jgi:hypothetical protein
VIPINGPWELVAAPTVFERDMKLAGSVVGKSKITGQSF